VTLNLKKFLIKLKELIKKSILKFISIYQKFFTLLGYGSCRYYPTCSQYTKQQFTYNSLIPAFFKSSKRILTCNQLFIGGIDYLLIHEKNFTNLNTKYLICQESLQKKQEIITQNKIKNWLVPHLQKNNKKYYLISNFSKITI
jgi:putative membrane protein insertion efficiency factor